MKKGIKAQVKELVQGTARSGGTMIQIPDSTLRWNLQKRTFSPPSVGRQIPNLAAKALGTDLTLLYVLFSCRNLPFLLRWAPCPLQRRKFPCTPLIKELVLFWNLPNSRNIIIHCFYTQVFPIRWPASGCSGSDREREDCIYWVRVS